MNERLITGDVSWSTDLLRRLRTAEVRLSANDRAIAAAVLRGPLAAAFSTAEELARQAGVSKAAVVRFAVRFGYPGFTELREDLRRQMNDLVETPAHARVAPPANGNGHGDGVEAVRNLLSVKLARDLASLSSFVQLLDEAEFVRCARLLARAEARVHVVGQRRAQAVAAHAARTLGWIRPDVSLFRVEESGLLLALDELRAGDVVLALAFHQYPRVLGIILEAARQAGATSILVTDSLACPFVGLADHVLACPSSGPTALDSSLPAVFCVEALADLMIQLIGRETVFERVSRIEGREPAFRYETADDAEDGTAPLAGRARAHGA